MPVGVDSTGLPISINALSFSMMNERNSEYFHERIRPPYRSIRYEKVTTL